MRNAVSPKLAFVFGLLLSGCTTGSYGTMAETSRISQIKVGVTDKTTVEQLLGTPMNRAASPGGDEMWMYSATQGNGGVPVVSSVVGGASAQSQAIQINFRKNVVASCTVSTSHVTTGAFSTITPGQSNSFPCDDPRASGR